MAEEQKNVPNLTGERWDLVEDDDDEDDDDFEFGKGKETPAQPMHQNTQQESEQTDQSEANSNQPRDREGGYNNNRSQGRGDRRDRDNNKPYNNDRNDRPRKQFENRDRDNNNYRNDKPRYENNKRDNFNNDRNGQQRGFNQGPREPRPVDQINYQSNYRQFYCNDPEFFLKVIALEEGPFEFKVHMFSKTGQPEAKEGEEKTEEFRNKDELEMYQILANYDAQNIRSHVTPWKSEQEQGKPNRKDEPKDKTRFTFHVETQENALKCFQEFQTIFTKNNKIYAKIFYLKSEDQFVKHADDAAKEYFENEEANKAKEKAKRDKMQEQRKKQNERQEAQLVLKKRLDRNPVGSQERADIEKDTAISFANKGKPMFTRTKPKVEPAAAQDQDVDPMGKDEGVRSTYVKQQRGGHDKTRGGRGGFERGNDRGGRGGRGGRGDRKEGDVAEEGKDKATRQVFQTGQKGRGRGRGGNGPEGDNQAAGETKEAGNEDEYGIEAPSNRGRGRGNSNRNNNRGGRKPNEGGEQAEGDEGYQQKKPHKQYEANEEGGEESHRGGRNNRGRNNQRGRGGQSRGGDRPYTASEGTGGTGEGAAGRGRGRGQAGAAPATEGEQKTHRLVYRKVDKKDAPQANAEGKTTMQKQASTVSGASTDMKKKSSAPTTKFSNKFAAFGGEDN